MLKKICRFWSVAALMIAAASANAATLFFDDFNRPASATVGNGWIESPTASVSIVTGGSTILVGTPPNNAMQLIGGCESSCPGSFDATATQLNINTTGFSHIQLAFDWNALNSDQEDGALIALWSTNGTSFTQLTPILSLEDDGSSWLHRVYSFTAAADNISTLAIRFAVNGIEEDNDGVKIDNVNITGVIPEPEIYAMMGIGLALMGFVARRRRQQAAAA